MKPIVEFRHAAKGDLDEAVDWYELQSPGLGTEFLRSLEAILSRVQRDPKAFPVVQGSNTRRALMRRFPFAVIYTATDSAIIIFAIFHVKRNPRLWYGRV